MLRGSGFVLRPLRAAEYADADAAREDGQSAKWVNALPQPDGERLVAFLDDQRRNGRLLHLAVADAESDSFQGEIVLFLRTPEAAEIDIGEIAYAISPVARGRGIASAAVRLLSEWAFRHVGVKRLQLSIHPDNVASQRVAEKAGYTYEGTLRSMKLIRGERVDGMVWSLLPDEV
jgi:RimJ/RimL family protein N-acetyltransferase